MKNILRVFKNDLNKIHNNVIAMIVIMGILVIPTLYAWFNIAASWDPYGSTDGLKIAVASEDAGYTSELINVDLNLGDDVIKALKENDNFNWVFTDADDAADGVKQRWRQYSLSAMLLLMKMIRSWQTNCQKP